MRSSCESLVQFMITRYRRAAEIGVGHCPDVLYALKQGGLEVFGTDIEPICCDGFDIFHDDVTEPNFSLYRSPTREVEIVYSLRPPPELVPYLLYLARTIRSDLLVKTLSSDHVDGPLMGTGRGTFLFWSFQ